MQSVTFLSISFNLGILHWYGHIVNGHRAQHSGQKIAAAWNSQFTNVNNYTMTCDVGITALIGSTVLKSVMMKMIMKKKMMKMGMTMKR